MTNYKNFKIETGAAEGDLGVPVHRGNVEAHLVEDRRPVARQRGRTLDQGLAEREAAGGAHHLHVVVGPRVARAESAGVLDGRATVGGVEVEVQPCRTVDRLHLDVRRPCRGQERQELAVLAAPLRRTPAGDGRPEGDRLLQLALRDVEEDVDPRGARSTHGPILTGRTVSG